MSAKFVDTLIKVPKDAQKGCAVLDFNADKLKKPEDLAPLTVTIKKNTNTNGLKVKLLDENGCPISVLCVPNCQYRFVEDEEHDDVQVLQLNALNAQLFADYVEFEGAGYFERRSTQNVHNLFCDAESESDIIQKIVDNNNAVNELLEKLADKCGDREYIDHVRCVSNSVHLDLLKLRLVALVELCRCGTSCRAVFPPKVNTFCLDRAIGCNRPRLGHGLGY